MPVSITYQSGSFHIDKQTPIVLVNIPRKHVLTLPHVWTRHPVQENTECLPGAINLKICNTLSTNSHSPEAYRLSVTREQIVVEATHKAGLFYGLQTLAQEMTGNRIPALTVHDMPRFAYRGVMLDVSRHFFPLAFLKRQIDLMAQFKLNRLHLHLTDAAGWRIQIKKYPDLTRLGAFRSHQRWKEWWNGKREYKYEHEENAHGGYYTQDELRDLVTYATERNVTIIPEIEMPAHSEEVLTAYPSLSCTHEPYKQADFCVGNDSTFVFLCDVLDEVMDIFPSDYIHIGGDEAGKASWHNCPLCQKRMQEEGLSDVNELQGYLIRRIGTYLQQKGRKLIGWDEIAESKMPENAIVMVWRNASHATGILNQGHSVILSPGSHYYLDKYQDAPHTQPEAIGGYNPLRNTYAYEPVSPDMSEAHSSKIYGIQGNLWTEYVSSEAHVEQMLYPRTLAVAETGWSPGTQKNWTDFHRRSLLTIKRLKASGYNPFELKDEVGNRPEYDRPVRHKAIGKKVTYNDAPYYPSYAAGGDTTLTDGLRGGWSYDDGRWQGFISRNRLDVTLDMGKNTRLHEIKACFMQVCGPGVFLPGSVDISVSENGVTFRNIWHKDYETVNDERVQFVDFGWKGAETARYVRYRATSGKYGGFLFTDEIIVN